MCLASGKDMCYQFNVSHVKITKLHNVTLIRIILMPSTDNPKSVGIQPLRQGAHVLQTDDKQRLECHDINKDGSIILCYKYGKQFL